MSHAGEKFGVWGGLIVDDALYTIGKSNEQELMSEKCHCCGSPVPVSLEEEYVDLMLCEKCGDAWGDIMDKTADEVQSVGAGIGLARLRQTLRKDDNLRAFIDSPANSDDSVLIVALSKAIKHHKGER